MTEQEGYNPEESKESADQNTEAREVGSQNIERTFLISKIPENLDEYESYEVLEAVYNMEEEGKYDARVKKPKVIDVDQRHSVEAVYIKKDKDDCYLETSVKRNFDGYRETKTEALTDKQFDELWNKQEFGRRAVRTRYTVPYRDPNLGEVFIQLDIFEAPQNNRGAVMASIDFASKEESEKFTVPDWFTEETTEEMSNDVEQGLSIFSGRLIPKRAIIDEGLGRVRQADYYKKSVEERADIKNGDWDCAKNVNEAREFRAKLAAEKDSMDEIRSLDFTEVKRGDIFIVEKMGLIDSSNPQKVRAFLDNKKEILNKDSEENKALRSILNDAYALVELAESLPQASGERQKAFHDIGALLLDRRRLFDVVAERYKITVDGIRKERLRGRESERCLVARIQKVSQGEVITHQAKIPVSDFHLEDVQEEFGQFKADLKTPGFEGWGPSRLFDRIGKVYRLPKDME